MFSCSLFKATSVRRCNGFLEFKGYLNIFRQSSLSRPVQVDMNYIYYTGQVLFMTFLSQFFYYAKTNGRNMKLLTLQIRFLYSRRRQGGLHLKFLNFR